MFIIVDTVIVMICFVGCGTSCVFSLLICSLNTNWKMTASDINETNIKWALKNIEANQDLKKRIKSKWGKYFLYIYKIHCYSVTWCSVVKVRVDTILEDLVSKGQAYDFIMCNPPFFSNETENSGTSSVIRKPMKRPAAKSVNTQKLHESVYDDGGEVGFVKKIIDESILIGDRIRYYKIETRLSQIPIVIYTWNFNSI